MFQLVPVTHEALHLMQMVYNVNEDEPLMLIYTSGLASSYISISGFSRQSVF